MEKEVKDYKHHREGIPRSKEEDEIHGMLSES